MKRILHLTLKKKWFDLIVAEKKKTEYRKIKEYWTRRLFDGSHNPLVFDEVHFRNGYAKDSPFMRVEWKGIEKGKFEGELCYAIRLGKILEVR